MSLRRPTPLRARNAVRCAPSIAFEASDPSLPIASTARALERRSSARRNPDPPLRSRFAAGSVVLGVPRVGQMGQRRAAG